VGVHGYEDLLAAEDDSFAWPVLDEHSAAAMCYTSGTTGRSKGIVYSHRSSYLHSMGACLGNAFALSEQDRVLPVVPMFHANAWGLAYAGLLSGADLILPDQYLQPAALVRIIGEERVTIAGGVSTIWAGVLTHMRTEGGDLSSLRLVIAGGSAVPHALQVRYEQELGVRLLQAWGMTETSPIASVAHPPAGVGEKEIYIDHASGAKASRLKLDEMVSRRGKLEDVNEAFRAMKAGEVARKLDITVSAGEQTYTLAALADLISAGVRMVQPDIVKMGGITGLLRCAALAHAHNYYINIAAEAGVLGLAAYVLFAGSALWYSYAAIRQSTGSASAVALGVLGALVATSFHNLFDVLYVHGMVALLGLLMVLVPASLQLGTVQSTGAPDPRPST